MKHVTYYLGLEVRDMADWLDIQLWGYAPNGWLRTSGPKDDQPTGVMDSEEIIKRFNAKFKIVPIKEGSLIKRVEEIKP